VKGIIQLENSYVNLQKKNHNDFKQIFSKRLIYQKIALIFYLFLCKFYFLTAQEETPQMFFSHCASAQLHTLYREHTYACPYTIL